MTVILDVQSFWRVLNYDLQVDGNYGGRTRDAVMRFEARRGFTADGVADAATLAALAAAVEARRQREDRKESATKAATPVAAGGAVVGAGAIVSAGADAARNVQSLNDGTVFGLVLVCLVVFGVGGFLLWRYAIQRAEGPAGEDTI